MAAESVHGRVPIRVVVVTLDAHLADAFERARTSLERGLPGLTLQMHVAADFGSDPLAAERARADIGQAHVIVCTQLFQEEYANAVLPAVLARREQADAVMCALCTPELVKCTRLGKFDMSGAETRSPFSPISLLKKLRGSRGEGKSSGERQMTALRTLPSILRFIPGTAQDVRAYLLLMQYWLAGSDENIEQMVRYIIDRYAGGPRKTLKGTLAPAQPQQYPDVGLWHPDLPGRGIIEELTELPQLRSADTGTVGVLVGRSYLLAGNVAHYAAVVRALESRGLCVVPAFASALDARPAITRYFTDGRGRGTIDAMINLTGFSLVGGPAYNDANAAQDVLRGLDVPYLTLQTLEFQTIDEWKRDARGLNPLQATLQIAIPELDGAIAPTVFGGKGDPKPGVASASEPITERVDRVAERVARLVGLRRRERAKRKLAIVLFNFPPNAGNTGSAAYLAVFPSLQRVLASLKEQGYTVELPGSADDLRERLTGGNREQFGAPANVHTRIPVDDHVRREVHLAEIEKTWGSAPGRQLADGQTIHVMGLQLGNIFIGVQPSFGWEGDPMRLLFEGGFSPTHAFSAFYRWVREDFAADAILHFGTHGALEFMPGKQAGLDATCWPDRLIGDTPNVYLYASNNSSEGTLAKRRGNAVLVSYLTPPIANAGLYRGLLDLKSTLDRWRALDGARAAEADTLRELVQHQAAAVELAAAEPAWTHDEADARIATLRERLLELEYSLIPMGLHVVGEAMAPEARVDVLVEIARGGRPDAELPPIGDTIMAGHSQRAGDDDAAQLAESVVRHAVTTLVNTGEASRAEQAAKAEAKANGFKLADGKGLAQHLALLAGYDASLREDHEVPGILRALDGRYVAPAPGGDLLRNPAVLPTGRNIYGFDPYRVPSAAAILEGRARAEQLLARHHSETGELPESVAVVLWGTDNMKSEGTPLAQVMALMGVVPRFDSVGRLTGARLLTLESLGRPRVDVIITLSGIFRDLLPLQVKLLAEAALLCAQADEDPSRNFVRKHALATMAETGCDMAQASLRVFSNADGAYGSNVNLLIETSRWQNEDELADLFVQRKSFAYGCDGRPTAQPALMKRALSQAALSFQGLDSVDLGATDIDQYVESLGGMTRVIAKERGSAPQVYVGDYNGAKGKVRTLSEQVELETRTKMLNPRWYESQLQYGYEGVRNIAGHMTTTLGWSATGGAGAVPQWVYAEVSKTFVLDEAMRERLAHANPDAASGLAQRLLEANDRGFWAPDEATLEALRDAAADLEDRLEGVHA